MRFSRNSDGELRGEGQASRVTRAIGETGSEGRASRIEVDATLSTRSVRALLDLIDNKLSAMVVIDREDDRSRAVLCEAHRSLHAALMGQTPARNAGPG